MAKEKHRARLEIKTFATHHVITQPNPLRKVLRRVPPTSDHDDPVGRAEQALAGLSGEFKQLDDDRGRPAFIRARRGSAPWLLPRQRAKSCFAPPMTSRATPPPSASPPPARPPKACAASSNTRPISARCRPELITHHINAIQAIVRERTKLDTSVMASALSRQLRGVADEFLLMVNRDRPEHLEAHPGAEHRDAWTGKGSRPSLFLRRSGLSNRLVG